MKKKSALGILIIVFSISCQAQGVYSKQNLEQASMEDLNLYLEKAQKLKKAGGIVSLAGPVTCVSGFGLFSAAWSGHGSAIMAGLGFGMMLTGLGATVVGLPIFATGSVRVNKVKDTKNAARSISRIDLAPCTLYNYIYQNFQPGIMLSIRF